MSAGPWDPVVAESHWRRYRASPVVMRMQMQLFGPRARRMAVSDVAIWRFLRALRSAAELDPFRIWLVGSRVEPGNLNSDVDLVLSPREGFPPADDAVERALWHCRSRGLYASSPVCVVDPCFRPGGPATAVAALHSGFLLAGVKLLSPRLLREAVSGQLEGCRPVGRFCVGYSRRAGDTNYYHKLPVGQFGGAQFPYLRPAIEIGGRAIRSHEADDRRQAPEPRMGIDFRFAPSVGS